MSTPLSATQMIRALKTAGLEPIEYREWYAHNRNHKGPWGPVHGIVIHHTAGVGPGLLNYVYNGDQALPGPLCHAYLNKNAELYLIGNGRTNHAGTIPTNALEAVKNESHTHPRPDANEELDGNRSFYGIEIENWGNGTDPYPAAQYKAAVKWAAAICHAHGWTEDSVVGHKEVTRRKTDPSFSMGQFRLDVHDELHRLDGTHVPDPTPKPKPEPKPEPKYQPYPGPQWFAKNRASKIYTAMGKRLIAKGFGKYYKVGAGPFLTNSDKQAYQAFQRSLGYTGQSATWPPGPKSWEALQVPKVK